MDNAEILREFVFSCEALAESEIEGPAGRRIRVQIRARGFEDESPEPDLTDVPASAETLPEMTSELEGVPTAIRHAAATGNASWASLSRVKRALARSSEPFGEARALHRLGWVSLEQREGKWGPYWRATPFDQSRRVYSIDIETVRSRIAVIVRESKSGRYTFYDRVRDRFVWMTATGEDAFFPVLQQLEAEGTVVFGTAGTAMTVSLPQQTNVAAEAEPLEPLEPLSDADFEHLNRLEDMEVARISLIRTRLRITLSSIRETL